MQEFPEADLIRKTFTLRRMDLPPEVLLAKRSLIRWFALSFGLISPKESRSKILDVLDAIFYLQISKKRLMKVSDILSYLKSQKKEVEEKALRYHLGRLLECGLLEWRGKKLGFVVFSEGDLADVSLGFSQVIVPEVNAQLSIVRKALEQIGQKYRD